jgi:SAM-dependent methyltransferase
MTGAWAQPSGRAIDLNCLREPDVAADKPYFDQMLDVLAPLVAARPDARLLDVGCSTGGFLDRVSRRWPGVRCTGVDLLEPVVAAAAQRVPAVEFRVADLTRPDSLPTGQDIVTMVGVHSLFDDPGCWVRPLLHTAVPGARIVLYGLFNPEPVDVLMRARPVPDTIGWQTGWNLWSVATVEQILTGHALRWTWTPAPDQPITRYSADPLHSWTVGIDGETVAVNGTQLVHRRSILVIEVPG